MSDTHEERYQRALMMGKPREHILKTLAGAWDAIESGEKTFEVRRNDRFFQRGDIVVLRKLEEDRIHYATVPGDRWKTYDLRRRIGWMLQGGQFGIEPGYCVFSLEAEDSRP